MPGRVHRPLAALVPVPPPTTGVLAVGHDPPTGKLGTGQLYRWPRRIFLTPSRPLIAARAILPRSPSTFRRSTVVPRGLSRPRGSDFRRDAAPQTDPESHSAPLPQSRSAGVSPWAAASSHAPMPLRTPLGALLHAGSTPADGVGWPRAGCGPSQHAQDTQDRPLTRPRTPSLACPGLLQWPHPYGMSRPKWRPSAASPGPPVYIHPKSCVQYVLLKGVEGA